MIYITFFMSDFIISGYSDLYTKLNDLIQKKEDIIEKIDSKFSNLIEKYELY